MCQRKYIAFRKFSVEIVNYVTFVQGVEEQNTQTDKADTSKGIEMNDDFEGELMDVSQSESDENNDENDNDDTDQKLESKMGDSGENEDVLDEKLWTNDGDELENDVQEKYETGASVQSTVDDLELRAKESNDDKASENHEEDEKKQNQDQSCLESSLDQNIDEKVEDELENLSLDKEDAYEPPSGVEPSVEPRDVNDGHNSDNEEAIETADDDVEDLTDEMEVDDHKQRDLEVSDEHHKEGLEDTISEKHQEKSDSHSEENTEEVKSQDENCGNQDSREPKSGQMLEIGHFQGANANDVREPSKPQNLMIESPSVFPTDLSQSSAVQEENSQINTGSSLMTSDGEQLTGEAADGQKTDKSSSASEIETKRSVGLDANPLRSLGDALKEWKERVLVKDAGNMESDTDVQVEDLSVEGNDYQYVEDNQASTAQALGSATADQAEENIPEQSDQEMKDASYSKDDVSMMDTMQEEEESNRMLEKRMQNISKTKTETHVETTVMEEIHNVSNEDTEKDKKVENDGTTDRLESYVSTKHDSVTPESGTLSLLNVESCSIDVHTIRMELDANLQENSQTYEKARVIWCKYEQITSRLSQELSEQLRLIMEPTLAARLEGDYRTGKRINLKKVWVNQ